MSTFKTLFAVYVAGGLTFIPLLLITILAALVYTVPCLSDLDDDLVDDDLDAPQRNLIQPSDDVTALEAVLKADKADMVKSLSHHNDQTAAGYFAVCREYTPMGVNAKPVERTTPAGPTPVAAPSQSIYQTMYKGIFERKRTPSLSLGDDSGGNTSASQRPKKAGDVYYVVLRHGHLIIFDDEDQAEVRYVISLLHHDIGISAGGETIPEGELFTKRNAISLSRKPSRRPNPFLDDGAPKPFFLFCESSSAKEDFYFALLESQHQVFGAETKAPRPLPFVTKHMVDLVQKIYATEDKSGTRWLNALLGRVFLGIYRTRDMELSLREKITNKISRIKRPPFLTHIKVRHIDLGNSVPFITNPRLRHLNVRGECIVEADVEYTGNFRIEIGSTAKVDIGSFNREVPLVLAVVLKKLQGLMLVKIKAPPTDRLWMSFAAMPKMEMTIEPIVSSRQITWSIILRQIESRIRDAFAESMVLPHWDDTPFFRTEHKKWRGGIWKDDDAVRPPSDVEAAVAQGGDVDEVERFGQGDKTHISEKAPQTSSSYKSCSLSSLCKKGSPSKADATITDAEPGSLAHSSRAPRAGSFSSIPTPIVGTDTTNSEVFKPSTPPDMANVASRMAMLSESMQHEHEQSMMDLDAQGGSSSSASGTSSASSAEAAEVDDASRAGPSRVDTILTAATMGTSSSIDSPYPFQFSLRAPRPMPRGRFGTSPSTFAEACARSAKRSAGVHPASKAAFRAREWRLKVLKRSDGRGHGGEGAEGHRPRINPSQPMGRGQPLPPPGVPLPLPDGKPPLPLPGKGPISECDMAEPVYYTHNGSQGGQEEDEMLVDAAPESSEPTTPIMTPQHSVGEASSRGSAPELPLRPRGSPGASGTGLASHVQSGDLSSDEMCSKAYGKGKTKADEDLSWMDEQVPPFPAIGGRITPIERKSKTAPEKANPTTAASNSWI